MKDKSKMVNDLFEIITQKKSIALADSIMAQDLEGRIDNFALTGGLTNWRIWINYLHLQTNKKYKEANFRISTLENLAENQIRVRGVLLLKKYNDLIIETPFKVEFYFDENYIIKVVSTRSNYVGILGSSFLYYPGTYWHGIKAFYFYPLMAKIFKRQT